MNRGDDPRLKSVLEMFDQAADHGGLNYFVDHVTGLQWRGWPVESFRAVGCTLLVYMPPDDFEATVAKAHHFYAEAN